MGRLVALGGWGGWGGILLVACAHATAPTGPPPVPGRLYTGNEVKPPPVVVYLPPLRYPDTLRAKGIEGRVLLDVIIDTSGQVEPASVTTAATPNPGFDAAARDAALGMRFLPGMVHGWPVRTLVRLPVQFRLVPDIDTADVPLRLSQVEEPPERVSGPVPVYPPSLRERAIGGRVSIRFVLDTTGHPQPGSFEVLESPHSELSREAIRVVRGTLFRPARLQGKARRVIMTRDFQFPLDHQEQ